MAIKVNNVATLSNIRLSKGLSENFLYYTSGSNLYKLNKEIPQIESFFPIQFNINDMYIDESNNIYGARSRNYDGLIKYSDNGEILWEFTQNTSFTYTIAYYDNHVYIGEYDQAVRKVDTDGNQIWIDTIHNDVINDINISPSGYIYSVSSDSTIRYRDDQNNYLGVRTLDGSVQKVLIDSNNNVFTYNTVPTQSSIPATISKLDETLSNIIWSQNTTYSPRDMALDSNDNLYILLNESSLRSYIQKIDNNGNQLWITELSFDSTVSFVLDENFIYVANNEKIFKLDMNANEIWNFDSGFVQSMALKNS